MIVTDMDDMEDIINTYNKQKEHKIYKGLLLSLSIKVLKYLIRLVITVRFYFSLKTKISF